MGQGKGCTVCKVVGLLVAIGAINWGLFGVFGLDVVARLLGEMTAPAKVVYAIIGLAGVAKIISCIQACPCCKPDGACETKK